jgi:glycosyltransferase involved in cell wall biosynthesis
MLSIGANNHTARHHTSDKSVETKININTPELSIVMPCLNEAETLAVCIRKAQSYIVQRSIDGEVIVADNGSTDGSIEIAEQLGAKVVPIYRRGYGSALQGGIAAASGVYIIMGDADDSYDFSDLDCFLVKLRQGYDLVMGNRFQGGIKPGAMPWLHKYLGNPVLTKIGQIFFSSPCGDFHCGLRGFRKDAIEALNLRTSGMEFASEMVVKAALYRQRITEVPTILSPDGRSRPPHLRTWRDGWRHLRFLLLYSPRWLFLYPGLSLTLLGCLTMLWLLPGAQGIFDIHTLVYSGAAILTGFQAVVFSLLTKVFAVQEGLLPFDERLALWLRHITLENGLKVGGGLICIGVLGSVYAFLYWRANWFGPIEPTYMMRIVIPSVTAFNLGLQMSFSSFFLSVLQLKLK